MKSYCSMFSPDGWGRAAAVAVRFEHLAGSGLELGLADQPGGAVPDHQATNSLHYLMDLRDAVRAAVLLEQRCHLNCDGIRLLCPGTGVLLPLTPGIEAAAGHTQPAADLGNGEAFTQRLDQAKPLGGTCFLAKCAGASLKNSSPS